MWCFKRFRKMFWAIFKVHKSVRKWLLELLNVFDIPTTIRLVLFKYFLAVRRVASVIIQQLWLKWWQFHSESRYIVVKFTYKVALPLQPTIWVNWSARKYLSRRPDCIPNLHLQYHWLVVFFKKNNFDLL